MLPPTGRDLGFVQRSLVRDADSMKERRDRNPSSLEEEIHIGLRGVPRVSSVR